MTDILNFIKTHIHYILPPLIGAIIGYITNAIAIKMLFKPYRPVKIWKFRLPFTPGIIPKQRNKIASGIGQIVSQKLLNAETIRQGISTKEMKSAVIIWLNNRFTAFLNYPITTLGAILQKLFKNDFEHYYQIIIYKIKTLVANFFRNSKNRDMLADMLDRVLEAFLDGSVENVLGSDVLQDAISKIVSNTLKQNDLQERIFMVVEKFFNQIFKADKQIRDVLPDGLIHVLSEYIKERIPKLIVNASKWIDDPKIKDVIKDKIMQVVYDYVQSLNFLKSMIAGLFNIEDKISEKIPFLIDRLSSELENLSQDENFVEYLEDKVDLYIGHFIDKKMNTLTKRSDIPFKKLLLFLKEIFDEILEDPEKIKSLLKEVTEGFNFEHKKLSSFITEDEKNRIKSKIMNAAFDYFESDKGISNIMKFLKSRIDELLFNKHLGSFQAIFSLKKSTILKFAKRSAKYLMFFANRETPIILESLDLENMVKAKIDSFPLEDVEDIILKIIKDQLKYINIFGAFLGFLIGLIQIFIR